MKELYQYAIIYLRFIVSLIIKNQLSLIACNILNVIYVQL